MARSLKSSKPAKENWFWELSSQWWFIPLYYVALAFVYCMIMWLFGAPDWDGSGIEKISFTESLIYLPLALIFMPTGIGLLMFGDSPGSMVVWVLLHIFWIGSCISIVYHKRKMKIILKKLIIAVLLLLLLSLVSCVAVSYS